VLFRFGFLKLNTSQTGYPPNAVKNQYFYPGINKGEIPGVDAGAGFAGIILEEK
jgi:hypothetical protein